jgi:hypothetical protein
MVRPLRREQSWVTDFGAKRGRAKLFHHAGNDALRFAAKEVEELASRKSTGGGRCARLQWRSGRTEE